MFFQAHKQHDWEKSSQQALRQWLSSPLGQQLFLAEQAVSSELLRSLPDRYCVQYGMSAGRLLSGERLKRCVHLDSDPNAPALEVLASAGALPLANDSVDLLLLVHALECYSAGPPLWAELKRVVRANGHVLVVGFNPYSLWALRHRWQAPQSYLRHAYSSMLVQRRLQAHGFQPLALRYVWAQTEATVYWPRWAQTGAILGLSYVCLARKQVAALTPLGGIKRWPREYVANPALPRVCGSAIEQRYHRYAGQR